MKEKNFSELGDTLLSKFLNNKKEKAKSKNINYNPLNIKSELLSKNNDELSMRKKIFNLTKNKNIIGINSFNLIQKKAKIDNIKLKIENSDYINKFKNNVNNSSENNSNNQKIKLITDKNESNLSIKKNKNPLNDLKKFSALNNNDIYLFSNIYTRKNSDEKKPKILFKENTNNYRKYLFNEKKDTFIMKDLDKLNENENKKGSKDYNSKHKGLFYLYNLQNHIYNKNKKNKNSFKYSIFNSFNRTINNNITSIFKIKNSTQRPTILFPKSVNNSSNKHEKKEYLKKYNNLNKNENYLNNIFFKTTNKIKNEENIFSNKMKLRKQNYKNKYLNILTQNDSEPNRKKIKNMNFLPLKNISNVQNKFKLKLTKALVINKTEDLLKNKNRKFKKYSGLFSNGNIKEENNFKKNLNNSKNNIGDSFFENISKISKISTAAKDSKYYMDKSISLSNYIKNYYNENKSYPPTNINFYLYGRRLGQGAFAKVNLGLNVLTGRVVAIKSFKKKAEEKFNIKMKKIQYETELMKRFNHKNITKILEVFHDEEYMLIIMEYINGENLFSFVKKRRKLSEKLAKFLFRQIILGIEHIHSKNVVHRDIKLENIMIDFNNTIKICDFGIGKVLKSEDELLYDKCGTPMYMAPEIILSNENDGYKGFPVDIWSSGITLYIMLSGTLPFNLKSKNNKKENISFNGNKRYNNTYLQNQIISVKPREIENISEEAKDLLKGILNKNPEKRLTCNQILNHPWLKNAKNLDLFDINNKNNLFTKAEMMMMLKTYIDYRRGDIEDLKENFTLSNLRNDEVKLEDKNISTKSSILTPFNSGLINNSLNDESIKEDEFDDFKNSKITLENDLMIFNNKVKEYNFNFEMNNNQEVDNGMIIKTHSENSLSSIIQYSSDKNISIYKDNDMINENDYISLYNKELNDNSIDLNKEKMNKVLDEIEKLGYDKKYVLNCIENNILCHASTVFYLLINYGEIE